MEDSEVPLPLRIERMIEMLCLQQCQPPPDTVARKILASVGEQKSMQVLKKISQTRITDFSSMIKDFSEGTDDSIFHSPSPKHLLRSPSTNIVIGGSPSTNVLLRTPSTPIATGGSPSTNVLLRSPSTPIAIGRSPSTNVHTTSMPVPGHLLGSPCSSLGNSCTPTRKKLNFSSPVNTIPENTSTISRQWQILLQLEFRKTFLVLSYIGSKKLEDVISEEDAYKILRMKCYSMESFELQIWDMYGKFSFAKNESIDRRKYLNWDNGKTHHYHCQVWRDGSFSFKLLHYFKESTPWTRMHPSPKEFQRKPRDFTCDELEHELFKLSLNMKNQNISMGVAADSWMAVTDKFLTLDDNSSEKKDLKIKMLNLIDIYYDALDASKTGNKVKILKEYTVDSYPHYMEKGKEFHSSSVLGKIYDAADAYNPERISTHEIRKLPLFELVQIADVKLKFWKENYDNYRQDMSAAMDSRYQSETNPADDVINIYKEIFYGASDFEQSSRNRDDIYLDALALYHVCYDFARSKGDVRKCNFAWRIAGPVLCNFHAVTSRSSPIRPMFYCLPSVLEELLN